MKAVDNAGNERISNLVNSSCLTTWKKYNVKYYENYVLTEDNTTKVIPYSNGRHVATEFYYFESLPEFQDGQRLGPFVIQLPELFSLAKAE